MFKKTGWYLFITLFSCSEYNNTNIQNKLLSEKVYLLYRGTNTKEGYISKEFNLHNPKPSHVGILIKKQEKWVVYHVLNSDTKSALIKSKIDDFLNLKKEKIKHISVLTPIKQEYSFKFR